MTKNYIIWVESKEEEQLICSLMNVLKQDFSIVRSIKNRASNNKILICDYNKLILTDAVVFNSYYEEVICVSYKKIIPSNRNNFYNDIKKLTFIYHPLTLNKMEEIISKKLS